MKKLIIPAILAAIVLTGLLVSSLTPQRIVPDFAECVNQCRAKTSRITLPLKFEDTVGPFSRLRIRDAVEYQACLIICEKEIRGK